MHPPAPSLAPRTESTFQPLAYPITESSSERHAIALIVERGVDVGLAGVREAAVSPGRAPAIADDETPVRSVADCGNSVAATNGIGLEGIQHAMSCLGIIPRPV